MRSHHETLYHKCIDKSLNQLLMKSLLFFFHSCLIFSLSFGVPGYPLLSSPVSGYHLLLELDHECGPLMPMGRHLKKKSQYSDSF